MSKPAKHADNRATLVRAESSGAIRRGRKLVRRMQRAAARATAFTRARLRRRWLNDRGLDVNLAKYGKSVYSQNDEDGILEYIFSCIEPANHFFVEIGVGPPWKNGRFLDVNEAGLQCNCRLLRDRGWTGVLIDGQQYPARFDVRSEFITAENINAILAKYAVPHELDLFSLDVDGNDYWIWKALAYRPRVVIVEYNHRLSATVSKTIKYDPTFTGNQAGPSDYYGASLLAMKKLGDGKLYTLVYANRVNAFFIRTDLLENAGDFVYERVCRNKASGPADRNGDEGWVYV
jgi:hypothetical protein